MPEEKVGFGFEFGIKGDKEVKKGLEDIIRMMGSAGNAASGIAGALSRAGGLLEFGKLGGVIGIAASAMATFAYKSAEAGENLRRTRFEIDRLSKMPVTALTDSDLAGNESAIIDQFRNLGLEAGNTFQLSFLDRLKNFGRGAYAVNWDIQASIANLFGAHMQSYEQGSQEGQDAQNRVAMDNKILTDRLVNAESYQQSLAAIRRKTAQDTNELYSLNFGGKPGVPGSGVMPESFLGKQRQMDIQRQNATWTIEASKQNSTFLQKQLDTLVNSPVPIIPGTSNKDTAKREQDKLNLEAQITAEMDKQQAAAQSILEINLQQREIQRGFVASQNYGSWRAVGGGGRVPINMDLFKLFSSPHAVGTMPTDVGYKTTKDAAQQLAIFKTSIGQGANGDLVTGASTQLATAMDTAKNAVLNFAGALAGSQNPQSDLQKGSNLVGDFVVNAIGKLIGSKDPKGDFERGVGVIYDLFNPDRSKDSVNKSNKPIIREFRDPESGTFHKNLSGNYHNYRLPFSSFHDLTASYMPPGGSISDSDRGLFRDSNRGTDLHSLLGGSHPPSFMGPVTHRYGYMDAIKFGNLPAYRDPSFHPGSMRSEDIMGDFKRRVHGWNSPMAGFNGVPGSMQGIDVLKSIDKNIGKIGTPTLAN